MPKEEPIMEPPPPPYPKHLPSPLDIKPRKRPITESALQSIRDNDTLAKLVEAVGEFDEAQGKEGLERRNAAAREIIRRKIAMKALGVVVADEEKKEEEEVDLAMDVDVEEEVSVEKRGLLPDKEECSVKEEGKVDIKPQIQGGEGVNDDANKEVGEGKEGGEGQEGGDGEGGESPVKKKKKKNKKKKKATSASSASAGGDASWAKGRGMEQEELEVEELGTVEEMVPTPVAATSSTSIEAVASTVVSQSPISTISNETIDIPQNQTQKKKKKKNKPHQGERKPAPPLSKKLEKVKEHVEAVVELIKTIPEGNIIPDPEPDPVEEEKEPESSNSPIKQIRRIDITKVNQKELLDLTEKITQEAYLDPEALRKFNEAKHKPPPGKMRRPNGRLVSTPAKKLNFDKIADLVKPEQKEIRVEALVQIKRDKGKGKIDAREARDPEAYIEASEVDLIPGKQDVTVGKEIEAEPVETQLPLDLSIDAEISNEGDNAIVLPSPVPKELPKEQKIERPKSAPPRSTWTLLKGGASPEQFVVPIDKIAIVMSVLKTGTIPPSPQTTLTKTTVEPEPTSPPQISIVETNGAEAPTTPDVPLGLTFTASPADHVPNDRYDGPPVIMFGDLSFINKTGPIKKKKPDNGIEATNSDTLLAEAITTRQESSEALVNDDTTALELNGVATDTGESMDKWNAFANDSDGDSDGETVRGEPSPPRAQEEVDRSSVMQDPAVYAIGRSPDVETPSEHDLVTPNDTPAPSFPKQSYPKSPLHQDNSRVSSYRTASVNHPSPLATTTNAVDDDELVPTRQNTPESDTTPTQSIIVPSPPVRRLESADSFMDIGMPAEVDLSNPMSIDKLKMDKAYTLYFTKQPPKESSPPGVVPKVYPPLGIVDVKQYTGGLIPVFTAHTFGDFFGSWMALRRQIAEVVHRPIEPIHRGLMGYGTQGLGLHLFQSDKTAHFFIKDVRPAWEDPMCTGGGKIIVTSNPAEVRPLSFKRKSLMKARSPVFPNRLEPRCGVIRYFLPSSTRYRPPGTRYGPHKSTSKQAKVGYLVRRDTEGYHCLG
jgi:hypothetical protein